MIPLLEEEISRFLEDLHDQESQPLEANNPDDDETQSVADGGEPEDDKAEESDTDGVPTTIRAVAAAALDVESSVEDALTNPTDHIERITRFDNIVSAIIENEAVNRRSAYEPMGWRNAANKWELTTTAKARKENESLPG